MRSIMQISAACAFFLSCAFGAAAQDIGRQLREAVRAHDAGKVKELLIMPGADVNAKNQYGQTALHIAASRGYMEMAKILIANGANLDIRDEDNQTPADLAQKNGNKQIADFLRQVPETKASEGHSTAKPEESTPPPQPPYKAKTMLELDGNLVPVWVGDGRVFLDPPVLKRGGNFRFPILLSTHVTGLLQEQITIESQGRSLGFEGLAIMAQISTRVAAYPLDLTKMTFEKYQGITGVFCFGAKGDKQTTLSTPVNLDIRVSDECKSGDGSLLIDYELRGGIQQFIPGFDQKDSEALKYKIRIMIPIAVQ